MKLRHPPTMLVLCARDDAVRRGAVSLLVDVRSLAPDRAAFDAFLRDVSDALRRAGHEELARQAAALRET
jgi:hypothetical protein